MNPSNPKKYQFQILIYIVLLLLCSGCGRPPEIYNPFRVPRQEFYPQLGRIAIVPMNFGSELINYDEALGFCDSLITKKLQEDEIEVVIVPSEESDSLIKVYMEELGGIYDPFTGGLDNEKFTKLRKSIIDVFRDKYVVDAVMFCYISLVSAHVYRDQARWDGAKESVAKDSFLKGLLGIRHSGPIPALSLFVEFRKVTDSLLYLNAGGIQVLQKIGTSSIPENIDEDEILTDEDQLEDAVEYALNRLLGIEERKRPGSIDKPKTRSTLLKLNPK